MIFNKLLTILLFVVFLGCVQEEANIHKSTYVLENSEGTYEKEGEYPGTSAYFSFSTTYTNDSAIVKLVSGWGESFDNPYVFPKNTLYVSFSNRFAKGDISFGSQFSDWLQRGDFPFVSDGDIQVGFGVMWFDEHGDLWISGKNI